ncbi:hypothetical protein DYQ48_00295 [Xanthomonas hortorum]|nr:hypothetical protein DYQ48_00295 [Xanthomonas hortorum]
MRFEVGLIWRMQKPSPSGAIRHGLRATGARALERPRRKRGPGRGAGVGVRVRNLANSQSTAYLPYRKTEYFV